METHYFTFGRYPENPMLKEQAVAIQAETPEIARIIMFDNFGSRWAFQYDKKPNEFVLQLEEAQILNDKYAEAVQNL